MPTFYASDRWGMDDGETAASLAEKPSPRQARGQQGRSAISPVAQRHPVRADRYGAVRSFGLARQRSDVRSDGVR
jgi:hypothetical protein